MTESVAPDLRRLSAVIFDLDGVLFDSFESNVAFYDFIMRTLGHQRVPAHLRQVVHRESIHGALRALLGDGPEYRQALEFCRGLDLTPFIKQLRLFPGVHQTLDNLGRRFRLAVATNRISSARPALEHLELGHHFETVVTPAEAGSAKPDARFMTFTLGLLGLRADQVVYVGDSAVDEHLCLNSGVALVAFRDAGLRAWTHVESMEQLSALLLGYAGATFCS